MWCDLRPASALCLCIQCAAPLLVPTPSAHNATRLVVLPLRLRLQLQLQLQLREVNAE